MDNLEDKTERKSNSARAGNKPSPDPTVQPKGNPSKSHDEAQLPQVMRRSDDALEATLLPHQSMQIDESMQFGPSARDIMESIFRFKWTLLVVFVLIAAPLIAAIWIPFVPKYRAMAEVRVRPIIPYLVYQTEESGKVPLPLYDLFLKTQVRIISGVEILQRVLDQPEIQQTGWYKNPPKSLLQKLAKESTPPIARLKESLSAANHKDTEIIEVTFTDPGSEDARLILDTIVDQYILYVDEMSDATQDEVYRQLVEQHKSLENEILGREGVIDGLRASLGTAIPQELISQERVRLDETQARLAEVQQNIDLLKWELNKFSAYDSNDPNIAIAADMENRPHYSEDEQWRQLNATLDDIRLQIETGPRKPEHPERKRLEKEVALRQELLKEREAQLDEQWLSRMPMAKTPVNMANIAGADQLSYDEALTYLKHQLERAEQEERLLLADIEKQNTKFQEDFQSAQLLEKQSAALSNKREVFDAVRKRLDQKSMERNAPGSIEILMRASVAPSPANDRRIMFSVVVTVLALGAGGGVAFLRASRNDAIYAARDMPHPMQVPFLGYMLATDTGRPVGKSLVSRYMQVKRDRSSGNESMRIVRTALLSRLNGHDRATLLITSTAAGTGKSHFAMTLGESLARAGKKVLVIDADLRKMTLTKRLDLSGEPGFIQSLRTGSVHKRCIQLEASGLSFLPAGKQGKTDIVYEEIANGAFKTCIYKLREQYDIILLDSPPILAAADATILSSQVDGIIMVERESVSHRSDVISALTRLASADGRLIGTVFVGSGRHEKYGYV